MKQGEKEAKLILERLGILFDSSYCDDNSKQSMPDFKTTDGCYIEVTHTNHNNQIAIAGNEFSKMSVSERISKTENAHAAYIRLRKKDYETDSTSKLTSDAMLQYKKDVALMKNHYGIACNGKSTEFNCDSPVIEHSVDNILHEIVDDKGRKHTDGKTDLFVFVTADEYKLLERLLAEREWNGCFGVFTQKISNTSFETIYICAWKFETQKYITEDSTLTKIEKRDDGIVRFTCVQY